MIRDSLVSWKNTTESLILILDISDEEKRDAAIEQMEKLLGNREALKPAIQPPFNEDELIFGQELLPLEKVLEKKLTFFMKTIRYDIAEQQKKKVSVNAYMDPYAKVFRDGTFYDKKK